MKLTKSQKAKVLQAIEQHERHKNSYFWTNNGNARNRRHTEERNNWEVRFTHQGTRYKYDSSVRVSCKNYYYQGTFSVDGVKKDIRAFKRLLS